MFVFFSRVSSRIFLCNIFLLFSCYFQNSGAVSIDIRGAKGPNAVTINGVYEPTDEVCSNWPVYRKRGDPTNWIEFFSASNKWYIKATGDKGRARGKDLF